MVEDAIVAAFENVAQACQCLPDGQDAGCVFCLLRACCIASGLDDTVIRVARHSAQDRARCLVKTSSIIRLPLVE
eukprot:3939673-Rhodomonas_salina.4